MRYLPNTPAQQKEMLRAIGASSIEDLLAPIPSKARLSRPLNLSAALSETDLIRHMRALAAPNADADDYVCFLGGGVYEGTASFKTMTPWGSMGEPALATAETVPSSTR